MKNNRFRNIKTRLACEDYNDALKELESINDEIAKTQREKDLKVDTINKKYESQLNVLIRKKEELTIIIKNTKEYVSNNG